MVKIRKSTIEDFKEVQDLMNELFQYHGQWKEYQHTVLDWAYSEPGAKYLRKRVSAEEGICLVVESNKKVVGFLLGSMQEKMTYRTVQYATLENLFLLQEYRSKNIGKKICNEFQDWASKQGAKRITLDSLFVNKPAIKFYNSLGFEPSFISLEKGIEQ